LLAWTGCSSSSVDTRILPEAAELPLDSSIVVVPFENLSSSRNAGLAVADLATSVVYASAFFQVIEISDLQDDDQMRFRRLELAPWERQIGINTANASAIGRALNADVVLCGSVGEYGFVDGFGETAAVGITVRLVRSADARVLWSGSLSRRVSSVAFSEESVHRLSQKVLEALLGRMVRELAQEQPPVTVEPPPDAEDIPTDDASAEASAEAGAEEP